MILLATTGVAPARSSVGPAEDCVPSGARLAFIRDLGPSIGFEIFTVRPDGTGLKRLTDNLAEEWGPKWSPDGTKIAFSSHRDGNDDIYVMDRTGDNVTRLTENDASDAVPTWSPDGSKIAFSSARDDPKNIYFDLFVITPMEATSPRSTVPIFPSRTHPGRQMAGVSCSTATI